MQRAAVHRRHSHITSLARSRTTRSTWTLATHARQSRCDYPHILLRERGISIEQATTVRVSVSPPGHHCPRLRLRLLTRAHLLSHIRLPLHRLHQNGNQQAALPPEAHTFVGTPWAPLVTGRYCWARLAIPAWILPRCTK